MKRRLGLILAIFSALVLSSGAVGEKELKPMTGYVLEHDGLA